MCSAIAGYTSKDQVAQRKRDQRKDPSVKRCFSLSKIGQRKFVLMSDCEIRLNPKSNYNIKSSVDINVFTFTGNFALFLFNLPLNCNRFREKTK